MDIGTKTLRSQLSRILDRVERGERVVVHRRGRAAAALVPLRSQGGPRRLPSLKAFRAGIRIKGGPLSQQVIDDRDEPAR